MKSGTDTPPHTVEAWSGSARRKRQCIEAKAEEALVRGIGSTSPILGMTALLARKLSALDAAVRE